MIKNKALYSYQSIFILYIYYNSLNTGNQKFNVKQKYYQEEIKL